jgi:hypothetical protein
LVEVLASHEGSHFCIIVDLLQPHTLSIPVIVQVYNIVCGTSLVLLSSLVDIFPDYKPVFFFLFSFLHMFPPLHISLMPFFRQVINLCILLIHFNFTHLLIENCKVFVKPFRLYKL